MKDGNGPSPGLGWIDRVVIECVLDDGDPGRGLRTAIIEHIRDGKGPSCLAWAATLTEPELYERLHADDQAAQCLLSDCFEMIMGEPPDRIVIVDGWQAVMTRSTGERS